MNAGVVLTGTGDSREIPIAELFSGDGKAPLNVLKGEILTEVVIPGKAMDGYSSYIKFANRESIDFPIVGTAFWASMKKKEYRVAFTAVDRKPLRGSSVEDFLKGKDLSEELLEEANQIASKEASPVKTSIYSPSYKRRMMGLLLRSAIQEAMRRGE
jgi:CO/xanthine dehydrogenase FAD-binding subunit